MNDDLIGRRRRLKDIEDNIGKDQGLLKLYEDELRCATEPRLIEKYQREILRQRDSLDRYWKEYEDLKKKASPAEIQNVENIAELLQQKEEKLGAFQKLLDKKPVEKEPIAHEGEKQLEEKKREIELREKEAKEAQLQAQEEIERLKQEHREREALQTELSTLYSKGIEALSVQDWQKAIKHFNDIYKRSDALRGELDRLKKLEEHVKIYKNQNAANEDLKEYIEDIRPENVFMIEYSSTTVQDLLCTLIESRTSPNIYLLLQHPKEGKLIEGQKERIWKQITSVLYQQEEFRNYPNLKILCYKQRASLRGRNFDDKLINIGWYIYKYEVDDRQYIYGHNQPAITFREGHEGFSEIKNMFNNLFKNLWETGIRLSQVCNELKNQYLCTNPDFINWCQEVSPKREERGLEIKR